MFKNYQQILMFLCLFIEESVNGKIDKYLKKLDDKLAITLINPSRSEQGNILFESDIALDDTQEHLSENDISGWKALPNKGGVWTERIIPYEFHTSVSSQTMKTIEEAMQNWEDKTCLKFVPRDQQRQFLRFRTDSDGCYTFVGRKHSQGQDVNLGEGCQHLQIAMHEIGHSLGFYHEHSRKDRGSNIKILWQNIQRGMTSQFNTGNDNPRDVPYDVTSIMHYSPMSFSSRIFQKNTMVSLDPHLQPLIGKFKGITFRDAKLANYLYSCNVNCSNKYHTKCQNEGYLGFTKDSKGRCQCVCPPNTDGEHCEIVTGPYYGGPECGGDIRNEDVIETPGYPDRKHNSCTWQIIAPAGKRISLKFLDFSFRPRINDPGSAYNGLCLYEHVELRASNTEDGEMYCGADITKDTEIVSSSNVFWILIKASKSKEGRGLKAKISFV